MDISEYGSIIAPKGDYSASTPKGATGKYGFSWLYHSPDIKKITGVKDKQEFLNNPKAQEKYFEWYVNNTLKPAIGRMRSGGAKDADEAELAKIIHLHGESGAKKYLKENPIPAKPSPTPGQPHPVVVGEPVTAAERDAWERMQSAAFQQGFLGDDHSRQPGVEFMKEHGIDPSRLAAIQQDFQSRKGQPTVRAGEDGFSDVDDFYGHKTSRQRYTQFAVEHIDRHGNIVPQDTKNYGTNVEQFQSDEATRKEAQLAEFAGMDDPTNNINYKPPVEEAVVPPKPAPDPNFPTRDPVTGRVTPALNKRLKDAAAAELAINAADAAAEKEEKKRSVTRRLLNGIFGNDSEGNPIEHVQ